MAARVGMVYIVDQIRLMISDPIDGSVYYTDDQIQGALDDNREDVDGYPLTARFGGTEHVASVGWWEDGVLLTDEDGNTLTQDSENLRRGTWTFSPAHTGDIGLTGSNYDIYGAAADLLEIWAGALVGEVEEWSADGMSVKRATTARLKALAQSYRVKARGLADSGVSIATLVRRDTWAV